MERFNIELTIKGECNGYPGPAGWGSKMEIKDRNYAKEYSGYSDRTSKSRACLNALIETLSHVTLPSFIRVVTDSNAVCTAIARLDEAHDNGWKKKNGGTWANVDLLEKLYNLKEGAKCKDEKGNTIGKHTLAFQFDDKGEGESCKRCNQLAKEQLAAHTY